MRAKPFIMVVLALFCGALAILAGNRWIQREAERARLAAAPGAAAPAPASATTVVVASLGLRFGTEVTRAHVREVPWPSDAVPPEAFRTVDEFLAGGARRVALGPIALNEPILPGKVTGPGQRGTLSHVIGDGMGAVTVPVNEVVGVGGFVLPGDRVDVILTRQPKVVDGTARGPSATYSDVVLQNVRVLAAGQVADERTEKPVLVNAVTLEVDVAGAQRLTIAAASGTLSLMLRRAGDVVARSEQRITAAEIGLDAGAPTGQVTVRVTRGTKREDYAVPQMYRPDLGGSRLATAR